MPGQISVAQLKQGREEDAKKTVQEGLEVRPIANAQNTPVFKSHWPTETEKQSRSEPATQGNQGID